MTVNYAYSRSNTDILLLPVRIQLSEKLETFSGLFIAFLESALNFEHFEKKNETHGLNMSKVNDLQKRVHLNA